MNEERSCTGDYACRENRVPMQMYCDLEQQNTKLKAQIDEVKEYCIKQKKHCLKEKEKDYIDDLGKEQLLGSYLTCELILSKLEEVGK